MKLNHVVLHSVQIPELGKTACHHQFGEVAGV